jgi:hypothetical protein
MPRLRARVITRNVPDTSITNYVRTAVADTLMTLPTKAALANKLLGFSSVGEPVATSMPSVATVGLAEFSNAATLTAATIDPAVDWARLAGRSAVGDLGQGIYKRRVGVPSHSAYLTSNGGTVVWELAEPTIRPEHLDAAGDGAVDDTGAIEDTIAAAIALQRPIVVGGQNRIYKITTQITTNTDNMVFDWGGATLKFVSAAAAFRGFSITNPANFATVTATAAIWAKSISVSSATNMAVGRYLTFAKAETLGGTLYNWSHTATITSVVGTTIGIDLPLPFSIDPVTTTITPSTFSKNVIFRNVIMDGSGVVGADSIGLITANTAYHRFENIVFRDWAFGGGMYSSVGFGGTYQNILAERGGNSNLDDIFIVGQSDASLHNIRSENATGFGIGIHYGSYVTGSDLHSNHATSRGIKFQGIRCFEFYGVHGNNSGSTGIAVALNAGDGVFDGMFATGNTTAGQPIGIWTSTRETGIQYRNVHVHNNTINFQMVDNAAIALDADRTSTIMGLRTDNLATIEVPIDTPMSMINGHRGFAINSGAGVGPFYDLYRYSASPAASDRLALIRWLGNNSALNAVSYAELEAVVTDATAASEDGQIHVYTLVGGARTAILVMDRTAFFPSTTAVTQLGGVANEFANLYLSGGVRVANQQVIGARDTGWTAMTGVANKASAYATGSITLPQLAERVKAIQDMFANQHGLINP